MATIFLVPKNNAVSTLNGGINDSVTSLAVASGEGALFPSSFPFNITLEDEILKCTNRVTDTFTVVRGEEGTTPASHADGKAVGLRITAKAISDLNTAVNAIESPSGFRAYRTTAQTIPNASWTKIECNNEEYDIKGEYDHVTNFRFTATAAGKYMVTAICGLDALTDGKVVTLVVKRNGAVWAGARRLVTTTAGAAGGLCFSGAGIMNLAATDYIELWIYHTDTAARDTPAEEMSVSFEVSRLAD